jgi:hypothetical protein
MMHATRNLSRDGWPKSLLSRYGPRTHLVVAFVSAWRRSVPALKTAIRQSSAPRSPAPSLLFSLLSPSNLRHFHHGAITAEQRGAAENLIWPPCQRTWTITSIGRPPTSRTGRPSSRTASAQPTGTGISTINRTGRGRLIFRLHGLSRGYGYPTITVLLDLPMCIPLVGRTMILVGWSGRWRPVQR